MDVNEFRKYGKEMVDYISDYLETIESRRVISNVEPGYLAPMLPKEAPMKPEPWCKVMKDVEDKIMPGITHWQHPRFHAYFPSGNSFPSILGDMLNAGIACIGFSWAASPACTELETIVLDWFGKAINLPSQFLRSGQGSKGGGVIQGSASECVLVSMLAARTHAIRHLKKSAQKPNEEDSFFLPKLVAYCSKEAHSCVEKAALISLIKLRILDSDEHGSLRGPTLKKAIDEDLKLGLHPCFVSTTLGTTGACAFDNLEEIGPIVNELPYCWLHVDAAYAGNGFICPELRRYMKGVEYADSFNTNPNKWLLVNFDCSCMWVTDTIKLTSAMVVDPLYLQHENMNTTIDYRHWGIPLSRRFRSLKLWFVLRNYGIEGLQKYVRNHCQLAKVFEKLVRQDLRFEVVNDVVMGLVCFRLKGTDKINQDLLASINASGKLHMIPSMVGGRYIIRFCVVYEHATKEHMEYAWEIIQTAATQLLTKAQPVPPGDIKNVKKLQRRFSFTRSVSREVYERRNSRNSLKDGATPIVVPEDDGNLEEQDLEDVFSNAVTINEESDLKEESSSSDVSNSHDGGAAKENQECQPRKSSQSDSRKSSQSQSRKSSSESPTRDAKGAPKKK